MTKIPIRDFPSTLGPACAPPLKAGENYNPEFDADYEAGVCRRSLPQTHFGCEGVACMISVSAESKQPSTTNRPGSCFLPLGEKFRISLSAQAVIPNESTTVSLNSISRLCFIWLLGGGGVVFTLVCNFVSDSCVKEHTWVVMRDAVPLPLFIF